jgi:hypothetical protein
LFVMLYNSRDAGAFCRAAGLPAGWCCRIKTSWARVREYLRLKATSILDHVAAASAFAERHSCGLRVLGRAHAPPARRAHVRSRLRRPIIPLMPVAEDGLRDAHARVEGGPGARADLVADCLGQRAVLQRDRGLALGAGVTPSRLTLSQIVNWKPSRFVTCSTPVAVFGVDALM